MHRRHHERRLPPNSLHDAPGIYYDGQLRLFRLRCSNSLYAFRVDDQRNLEHLYWGPPLPPCDDITYLIRGHVPMPFDPRGTVSIAKVLGLEELDSIGNVEELSDKWKVVTKTRDKEHVEQHKKNRRLENAMWRLWQMERTKGGDLNRDLSDTTIAKAIKLPEDDKEKTNGKPGDADHQSPQPSDDEETVNHPSRLSFAVDAHTASPIVSSRPEPDIPRMSSLSRTSNGAKSMVDINKLAKASEIEKPHGSMLKRMTSDRQRQAKAQQVKAPHAKAPHAKAPHASPGIFPRVPSAHSPSVGSFGDLSIQEQNTNWGLLDVEELGKNTKLLEFSDQGTGDYRDPSFKVNFSHDGSSVCPLVYKRHKIMEGKAPMPSPMPGMYTDDVEEATTLIVDLEDILTGLRFLLHYTVFHDYDIICRRTVVVNNGKHPVTLKHLVSGTFDFDAEPQYYLTQLCGGWARERGVRVQPLDYGTTLVKSSRGASSHQFNPHIVISPNMAPEEEHGDCFGFTLVYSGNFAASCEVTEYNRLRVNMGINPENFTWYLDTTKGANTFHSPELIMSFSNQGMGGLSRTLHRAMRERLLPRNYRYAVPPVLINTWEAAYFNVRHEVVLEIAHAAAEANIELLVLDDGWFGNRNNTNSGLGDWHPNVGKFPYGIKGVAKDVHNIGLKFGIWVEPEMVSLDSDLYRQHPDWCLCVPSRSRTTGRNQLVLDFSRKVVRDHISKQLHDLLENADIDYVKWDMNRHLTEVFSQEWHKERQGEISHRFILGVYEVLGKLTEKFPHVLVETCSGGGGRFDAGMLYFTPQIWASDNTDALSRVSIQYGTSLAYPSSAMGAHVSAVPNHQTLRTAPMKTRSLVAMSGTFGYELDPRVLSKEDLSEIRGYIELQKKIAPLVYEGDMYRLWSPFRSTSAAWMYVSRNQKRAVIIAVNIRRVVGQLLPRLKLRGLLPDTVYRIEELCPGTVIRNNDTGAIDHAPAGVYQYGEPLNMTGRTLANAGLPIKFVFDADSVIFELNESMEAHKCNSSISQAQSMQHDLARFEESRFRQLN